MSWVCLSEVNIVHGSQKKETNHRETCEIIQFQHPEVFNIRKYIWNEITKLTALSMILFFIKIRSWRCFKCLSATAGYVYYHTRAAKAWLGVVSRLAIYVFVTCQLLLPK